MSEAVAAHGAMEPAETPLTPESWGKLGMWLFLAGDAMSFGGLIVGYGILRHASNNWPNPSQVLGINLTDANVFNAPLLATDDYGNFIKGPLRGMPQVVVRTGNGVDGIAGTADAPRARPHRVLNRR
jgi:hypothetical protein